MHQFQLCTCFRLGLLASPDLPLSPASARYACCAAYLSGSYLASASGSDPDWQAPGGNDWLMSDFFDGASGPGSGPAGSSGQQGDGGGGAADNDFFALRSTDWAESIANEVGRAGGRLPPAQRQRSLRVALACACGTCLWHVLVARACGRWCWSRGVIRSRADPCCLCGCGCAPTALYYCVPVRVQVGEGNSFRQQQRERYAPPIVNMTNLAHATEEDLLLSAEQQVWQPTNQHAQAAVTATFRTACCVRQTAAACAACDGWLPL
jgi:hypothetical protein